MDRHHYQTVFAWRLIFILCVSPMTQTWMTALNKQILAQSPRSHVEDLYTEKSHKEACGLIWCSVVVWFVHRIWNDIFLLSLLCPPKHRQPSGSMNLDLQWINPPARFVHWSLWYNNLLKSKESQGSMTKKNLTHIPKRVGGLLLEVWRHMSAQRKNQTTYSTNRFTRESMLHLPSSLMLDNCV